MLRDNSRQKSKIPKNAISSLAKQSFHPAFIFLSHWPPLILPSPSLSIGHSCKWRAAGKHDGYRCNLRKCCYFESRHTHTKVIYKWKYRRNSQPRQQTTKVLLAPPTQPPPPLHPASSVLHSFRIKIYSFRHFIFARVQLPAVGMARLLPATICYYANKSQAVKSKLFVYTICILISMSRRTGSDTADILVRQA